VSEVVFTVLGSPSGWSFKRSPRRLKRRLDKGRSVTVTIAWTDSRLVPERAKVVIKSGRATLRRSFQPEIYLNHAHRPLSFGQTQHPAHVVSNAHISWIELQTPAGIRYLGGEAPELALIAWYACWPWPRAESAKSSPSSPIPG
jgi:hypothetical protein